MKHTGRFLAMVVACTLLGGHIAVRAVASLQQVSPPPQQPSFKAGTVLVQVDAIVTDKNRAFVADLTADDFEVLEDGVPQTVEQIFLALEPGLKTAAVLVPEGARPSAVVRSALPAPPANDTRRTFVLLFDSSNMQAAGFDRARKAALQFLGENFRSGDIGGVVNNGAMVNNRLTMDRSELEAALNNLNPSGDARSVQVDMREWPRLVSAYEVYLIAEKNDRQAIGIAMTRACTDDPDACKRGVEPPVVEKALRLIGDFRVRGQNIMRAVRTLVGGLRKLPGRKTVILLTDGFIAEDEWANLRQITDEANRASVRIYSLDTRGLNRGSASSDIIDMGSHAVANPGGELPGITGFDIASDGPNSLAVDTGGLAIRNENDFPKAMREFAIDTSSYYVLGYRTTNTKLDGKFRSIAVRLNRKGLTVRARKGYLATPDLALAANAAAQPTTDKPAEPKAPAAPDATPPAVSPAVAPPPVSPVVATPPVSQPGTPPNAAVPGAAAAPAPVDAAAPAGAAAPSPLRLQPDVKDRLAKLGVIAPDRATESRAASEAMTKARAGWDAYQSGDLRGAEALLGWAVTQGAVPPWVHYALGWSQFALSEYPAAATEWEKVRQRVPEFEPVYFDLADSYLQVQDYGRALEVLREAEKRWPKDVEVYNAIGVVQTGRYALNDAIKTFEKAVVVKSDDPTANYNLARVCELRYIQAERLRGVSRSVTGGFERDKDCALQYYRRTIELGGLFVEEAKAGLKRLEQ
jgi:VWFA-related protein